MSNPLRSTLQFEFFKSEEVDTTTLSKSVDLGSAEGPISIMAAWSNGSGLDAVGSLLVSNDNINFVEIPESLQAFSGASGVHMWELLTGCEFLKVNLLINGGSATFYVELNGKTRN